MRRIRSFLFLSLIPFIVYAHFSRENNGQQHTKITFEWNRHTELIEQFNKVELHDQLQNIGILYEAITCCQNAKNSSQHILNHIKNKSKRKRRQPYWVESKHKCAANIEFCDQEIANLQKSISFIQAGDKYQASLYKAAAASDKDKNCVRKLNNVQETGYILSEVARLYEEAVALCNDALTLIASYPADKDKEILGKNLKNFRDLAQKSKKEAEGWPLDLIEAFKKRCKILKEEEKLFDEKNFKRSSCAVRKQQVSLLEQLLEYPLLDKKEAYEEELSQLQNSIAAFEKEANANRLMEKVFLCSEKDFRSREKERKKLFYQNEPLLSSAPFYPKEPSYPSALPLDGSAHNKDNSFTLYTHQFFRFFIQNKGPVYDLIVKVYKKGEILHEEVISLPLKNSSSWERYLTEGLIFIPQTTLKTAFGLDLRLSFVCDPRCDFSLIIAQRCSMSEYEFSFSLKEGPPLYLCSFLTPPPWQLSVLQKPSSLSDAPYVNENNLISDLNVKKSFANQERYPILDEFVKQLKSNPLALSRYVYNEIELDNYFSHREEDVFQTYGIRRNPCMTFLSKLGSPWEQCHLLIYLLRQAGYPAFYLAGCECSLPKSFSEKLLFIKLPEDQEEAKVNYPGIIFFDGKEWISLFPWMKEIQMQEGYDLYNLLPEEYADADRWILQYLTEDEKILKHIGPGNDDTLGALFVPFAEEELRKQGLSLSDVGIQRTQIKKQFSTWEDFLRPKILNSPQILDSLDKNSTLFSKILVEFCSHENPQKKIFHLFSLTDLNCNFIPIRFETYENNRQCLCVGLIGQKRENRLALDESDQAIDIKITNFENCTQTLSIVKGTEAALCFHLGGASAKITSEYYQKFSSQKETKRLYDLLAYVGAAYFEKCSRTEKTLVRLHKTPGIINLAFGLVKFQPTGNETEEERAPQVDMIWIFSANPVFPKVGVWQEDILSALHQVEALVMVDTSSNEHQILMDIFGVKEAVSTVKLLQLANREQRKKGLPEPGFLILTPSNMKVTENNPELAQDLYFSNLKELNLRKVIANSSGQWDLLKKIFFQDNDSVFYSYGYMTPGLTSSQKGFYKEMGALFFHPEIRGGLISGNNLLLNGGLGAPLPKGYFTPSAIQEWQLVPNFNSGGSYSLFLPPMQSSDQNNIPHSIDLHPSYQIFPSDIKSDYSHNISGDPHHSTLPPNIQTSYPDDLSNYAFPFFSTDITSYLPSYASLYMEKSFSPGITKWYTDVRGEHKTRFQNVLDPIDVVTGAFYVDEVDLLLPGPCPLEIRRNYNSQNPLIGDLGCGWKLALNPFLILQDEKLYAVETDGTVIAYSYSKKRSRWEVLPEDNPDLYYFSQKSGVNIFQSYIENDILYSPDGSKRIFEEGLLRKWVNAAGNFLSFFYTEGKLSSIESSTGEYCGVLYNHEGKISEIYAKDGRRIYYNYNWSGDLTKVTLPNGADIIYEYDNAHRIIRETKPGGQILENIYKEGKVVEQCSPMGPGQTMITTALFDYKEGSTVVTDAKEGKTIYKIFQKQIYKIIDPLGFETLQSWFIDTNSWFDPIAEKIIEWKGPGGAAHSLKSSTDRRGLTTDYLYDGRGNIIELTLKGNDLTGKGDRMIAKKFLYNDLNLCIEEEVLKHKTLTFYDALFPYLPRRVERYSYNVPVSYIDLEYNSLGQVEKEERSGSVTLWQYDPRGFPRQKTEVTGTDDPNVITAYSYNDQGQCIEIRTFDGIRKNEYDIMGNLIESKTFSTSGELLSATYISYSLNNDPILKRAVNPNRSLYLDYNAGGAIKATGQSLGRGKAIAYTLFDYDSRGYLIEETDPLGHTLYREYDAMGRMVQETKEGLSTLYSYESGGLVESITSPSGGKTSRFYTTNGLLKEELFPDGTKHTFVYDFFGRPTEETINNITWNILYDDAHHSIVRTNASTKISEMQEFDPRGNIIRFTDAAGFISEKTYDGLNRIKSARTPLGEETLWKYEGNLIVCILPGGEIEEKQYEGGAVVRSKTTDALGKLIAFSSCRYDPKGDVQEVVQGNEVTLTWFNGLNLPIKVQKGEITQTYEYDACGNCTALTDGDGRTTRQKFDGLRRLIKKELPDGSVIEYGYDLDSNISACHLPNGAVWIASYDLMDRKIYEELQAAGLSSLRWEYRYDKGYLQKVKDPEKRIHSYLYDSNGCLVQETADGWQRNYTYDPRGLLVSAEQIAPWSWPWSGSDQDSSKVERVYDGDGRIILESTYLNSLLIQKSKQSWDSSGRSLYIDDHVRDFTYQNNKLAQVKTEDVVLSYTYDLGGFLIEKNTPFYASRIEYDPAGLPDNISMALPEGSYKEKLNWYPSGKLSHYISPLQQVGFAYTPRGQLESAGEERYEFDFGNAGTGVRTKASGSIIPQQGLDDFGKIVSEIKEKDLVTMTYNLMGRLISQGKREFEWDPWGRLIKVKDESFLWKASYDAFGRRLKMSYSPFSGRALTIISLYDPEEEFKEIGVKFGDKTFWKIFGPTSCDAVTDETGACVGLLQNALGGLIGVVAEGKVIYCDQYPSSYGPQSSPSIPFDLLSYAQSLTWRSHSMDPTGLILMGARYYDPQGGRFLSPDPIGYPLSLDLYAYAGGDPINYLDLDGRFMSHVYEGTKSVVIDDPKLLLFPGKFFKEAINKTAACYVNHGCTASGSYEVGSFDLSNGAIGFINGIDNTPEDAQKSAEYLSELGGGVKIHGIYNATNSLLWDVAECAIGRCGIHTPPVKLLINQWLGFDVTHGPDAKFMQICHSGGAQHVKNALESVPQHIRNRVIVVAINPSVVIPEELCYGSNNYASQRDVVTRFDIVNYIRYRGKELQVLKPHPEAGLWDHDFKSLTFRQSLRRNIRQHLQKSGGYK